ncbi:MAG: hypothetical protein R2734_03135 [Nocardioides sp.]
MSVFLGVMVLGERLRPVQTAALGLATAAVGVLTLEYGRLPWVALVLALSFGGYGLVKKVAGVGAVESLAFETAVAAPVAAAYLGWLALSGAATFGSGGTTHSLLLASTGLITAAPLVCFGAAAIRVRLVTLGLLQYVAPTLQFLLGVWWFREAMTGGRWIGFALVWSALAVFTIDAVRHHRREIADAAAAAAF